MSGAPRSDHFAGSGGLALRRLCWEGDGRRVVALVHGLAEHAERYDSVARWLAARGDRVYAYDQRGHGESEGPRTHAPSFAVLLDDLERFLASVRREVDDRGLILCGHSMGGLEVATLLATRAHRVGAAVLSGPALALGPGVGRGRIRLARWLSRLLPRLHIPSGIDPAALSRDPAVQEAYRTDPRIPGSLSVRLASELFRAVERVQALAPRIRVPVLLVHGEEDRLCPAEGSRRFHASLEPPGCAIHVYPGLRHEVFNEPEGSKVLEDVDAWVARTAAGGARVASGGSA